MLSSSNLSAGRPILKWSPRFCTLSLHDDMLSSIQSRATYISATSATTASVASIRKRASSPPLPVRKRSFLSFPYVCPEPVSAKCSFLYINGAKSGVFRTLCRFGSKRRFLRGLHLKTPKDLPRQAQDRHVHCHAK
eukprot:COSAG06_NODE_7958_length_2322_cov_105.541610_3_plen_136_part_00